MRLDHIIVSVIYLPTKKKSFFLKKHHKYKKDSPSGTAKLLVNVLDSKINIQSLRLIKSNAVHEIIFYDSNERITIS